MENPLGSRGKKPSPYLPIRNKKRINSGSPLEGEIHQPTLVVKVKCRDSPLAIPLTAITRFEVSRGEGSRAKNTLIGAGIGLLVGGSLGAMAFSSVEESDLVPKEVVGIGVGFPFSLAGVLMGATASSDRWKSVPLPLSVSFSPHGGARVALRFEFD